MCSCLVQYKNVIWNFTNGLSYYSKINHICQFSLWESVTCSLQIWLFFKPYTFKNHLLVCSRIICFFPISHFLVFRCCALAFFLSFTFFIRSLFHIFLGGSFTFLPYCFLSQSLAWSASQSLQEIQSLCYGNLSSSFSLVLRNALNSYWRGHEGRVRFGMETLLANRGSKQSLP